MSLPIGAPCFSLSSSVAVASEAIHRGRILAISSSPPILGLYQRQCLMACWHLRQELFFHPQIW